MQSFTVKLNQKLKITEAIDARRQIMTAGVYVRRGGDIMGKVTDLFSLGKKTEVRLNVPLCNYKQVNEDNVYKLSKESDGWWLTTE